MKRFLFVVLLAVASAASGQNVCSYHNHAVIDLPADPPSAEEGKEIIENIISIVGLRANFEILPAKVPNAAAVVYHGKRYILYNPLFISKLTRTTGSYWSAVSVLAHEIGHHVNGHTLDGTGSQPAKELEADEFSGFALSKMGAPLESAQAAMRIFADVYPTSTHPGQSQRLRAIARGWTAGQEEEDVATEQDSRNDNDDKQEQTTTAYIWKMISIPGDAAAQYYVTTQGDVIRRESSKLEVVGKWLKLDNQRFPHLIKLINNENLFVTAGGTIVTSKGLAVGEIL
jgi:hypothetical protein